MKHLLKKIQKSLYTQNALKSLAISVVLIIIGYFSNNWTLFTGENLDQYNLAKVLTKYKEDIENDVRFINVSYDKVLAPTIEPGDEGFENTQPVGYEWITDRKKVYDFLKLIKESGVEYKYIILDIIFLENKISCDEPSYLKTHPYIESTYNEAHAYDDSLFNLIHDMDRIIVPRHKDEPLASTLLDSKSACADYFSTITATNFTRYQYLRSFGASLPLRVYEDLNPDKKIKFFGIGNCGLYYSKDGLCQNSCFLLFYENDFDEYKEKKAKHINEYGESFYKYSRTYTNLFVDYLDKVGDDYTEEELIEEQITDFENKYIIIGNLTEDVHDTYAGPKPGSLILYKAIKTLDDGGHLVSFWMLFLWFATFSIISFFIIKGITITNIFRTYFSNHKKSALVIDMLSYTVIIMMLEFADFFLNQTIHSFIIPLVAFSILKLYINFKSIK